MTMYASKPSETAANKSNDASLRISLMSTFSAGSQNNQGAAETAQMTADLAACVEACEKGAGERAVDEMFSTLFGKYPDWHVPHRVLGLHYLPTSPAKALKELQSAEALVPDDVPTVLALVRAYTLLRQYAMATNKLEQLRQIADAPGAEISALGEEIAKRSNDIF